MNRGSRLMADHRETRTISDQSSHNSNDKLQAYIFLSSVWKHEQPSNVNLKKNQKLTMKTLTHRFYGLFLSILRVSFYSQHYKSPQFWHETYDSVLYSTNSVTTDYRDTSYYSILLQYSTKCALCWLERGFQLMKQKTAMSQLRTYAIL